MDDSSRRRGMLRATILFEIGLGLLAGLLCWATGIPVWSPFTWTWAAIGWGVAATLPPVAALLLALRLPFAPWQRLLRLVDEMIGELFADSSLTQLALVAVAAGWGEELLFRGFLQTFAERYFDPLPALVMTSLAFGLAHALTKTYALLATAIGLYLGWLFQHFDNLLVPILAHALYDFVALIYLVRFSEIKSGKPKAESE